MVIWCHFQLSRLLQGCLALVCGSASEGGGLREWPLLSRRRHFTHTGGEETDAWGRADASNQSEVLVGWNIRGPPPPTFLPPSNCRDKYLRPALPPARHRRCRLTQCCPNGGRSALLRLVSSALASVHARRPKSFAAGPYHSRVSRRMSRQNGTLASHAFSEFPRPVAAECRRQIILGSKR